MQEAPLARQPAPHSAHGLLGRDSPSRLVFLPFLSPHHPAQRVGPLDDLPRYPRRRRPGTASDGLGCGRSPSVSPLSPSHPLGVARVAPPFPTAVCRRLFLNVVGGPARLPWPAIPDLGAVACCVQHIADLLAGALSRSWRESRSLDAHESGIPRRDERSTVLGKVTRSFFFRVNRVPNRLLRPRRLSFGHSGLCVIG